ncbi:MAG: cobyric acid synthase [Roseburia sp.]|nr:cobyric acid synthase [Roseburia sp.]
MAKVIMIQGTMSGAGKSLLTAGLCRIMKRDGYHPAPFKSQNMALNSYITKEGLEMGRAQVMQAEAAGIEPLVCMNPILLKPTNHIGSQVIVNGEVLGNMSAREYFSYKKKLVPDIIKAFHKLEETADIIVIEGAGSPAEINLRENDIVNMGMAELVDAPVLLAGDIDRGGVFAQLLGTLMLLTKEEKKRVKGLIINKFRGDKSLLDPGIAMLEQKGGVPVSGVIPYMEIALEDEDSLTQRFDRDKKSRIDMAVIRYPRISNFTDFNIFEQIAGVSVRYVDSVKKLDSPDIVFLPGSKNTMSDLSWMRENGLEEAVKELAKKIPVCGICGGYQMLGMQINDPQGLETGGKMPGMGLLPVMTTLQKEKVRRQVQGTIGRIEGVLAPLAGLAFEGYEIHMGESVPADLSCSGKDRAVAGAQMRQRQMDKDSVFVCGENKNVYGTYVHGIFDKGRTAAALVDALAEKKGIRTESGVVKDYKDFKESQYEKLADILSEYLNMEEIYGMLTEARFR